MNAETLIEKTPNLRAPSPTVVRLLNLLKAADADYEEVITIVSRDAVLSAKLLRLCNSACYGLAQPVSSLDQAVIYLGYGEIHRLVMAVSFGGPIGVQLPGYDMDAGTLWRHSLVTALLTPRVLGHSKQSSADTSTAYTAGLLHDIGKLVIGHSLDAARRERIHRFVEAREGSLIEAEKAVLGCDHAEVGACLLRRWRIPEVIADAVQHHHQPPADGGAHLSAVVHVADVLAHQTGASPGWSSFAIAIHESALTSLRLSATDLETLTFAALDCHEKAEQQDQDTMQREPAARRVEAAQCTF
jgi:putative nucleotidyltransferase with HDIG domain